MTYSFQNDSQHDNISMEVDRRLSDSALGDSILVNIKIIYLQFKHIFNDILLYLLQIYKYFYFFFI